MKKLLILALLLGACLALAAGCAGEEAYPSLIYIVDGEVFHEDVLEEENERFDRLQTEPEKDGYLFGGWYYDSGIWAQPLDITQLNKEKTEQVYRVYAKWETVELTLAEDKMSYTVTGLLSGAGESVSIPKEKNGYPVTAIASRAFAGNTTLVSISIPNSVKTVGERAFEGCTALKSVVIPHSVTSLGSGAFSNCVALESVTLSASLHMVEASTFFNCRSLASVTVFDGVTKINYMAFAGCTSLTSLTLPASVKTVAAKILDGSALTVLTFGGSQITWQTVAKDGFAEGSSLTAIRCTDGDVSP